MLIAKTARAIMLRPLAEACGPPLTWRLQKQRRIAPSRVGAYRRLSGVSINVKCALLLSTASINALLANRVRGLRITRFCVHPTPPEARRAAPANSRRIASAPALWKNPHFMVSTAEHARQVLSDVLQEYRSLAASALPPSAVLDRFLQLLTRASLAPAAAVWFKLEDRNALVPARTLGSILSNPAQSPPALARAMDQVLKAPFQPVVIAPGRPEFEHSPLQSCVQFLAPIDGSITPAGVLHLVMPGNLHTETHPSMVALCQHTAMFLGAYLSRRRASLLESDLEAQRSLLKLTQELAELRTPDYFAEHLARRAAESLAAHRCAVVTYWSKPVRTLLSHSPDPTNRPAIVQAIEALASTAAAKASPLWLEAGQLPKDLEDHVQAAAARLIELEDIGAVGITLLKPANQNVLAVLVGEYQPGVRVGGSLLRQQQVASQLTPALASVLHWHHRPLRKLSDWLRGK